MARYYEAVHQRLAPLARTLEQEGADLRASLEGIQRLAVQHRSEAWAQTVLQMCAGVGMTVRQQQPTADLYEAAL